MNEQQMASVGSITNQKWETVLGMIGSGKACREKKATIIQHLIKCYDITPQEAEMFWKCYRNL